MSCLPWYPLLYCIDLILPGDSCRRLFVSLLLSLFYVCRPWSGIKPIPLACWLYTCHSCERHEPSPPPLRRCRCCCWFLTTLINWTWERVPPPPTPSLSSLCPIRATLCVNVFWRTKDASYLVYRATETIRSNPLPEIRRRDFAKQQSSILQNVKYMTRVARYANHSENCERSRINKRLWTVTSWYPFSAMVFVSRSLSTSTVPLRMHASSLSMCKTVACLCARSCSVKNLPMRVHSYLRYDLTSPCVSAW